MDAAQLKERISSSDFRYSASRSSGPGGQNVNKVNTRIELRFNILSTGSLTPEEKELVMSRLATRINSEGDLIVTSQSERTQLQNREKAEERLYLLLARALTVKPKRKKTGPTAASREKRLTGKKIRSKIKTLRKDSAGTDL
jgi:ribosome-associated protein